MGPLDAMKPWTDTGVKGVYNFIAKAYRFFADTNNVVDGKEDADTLKILHQTIKKVEYDIENLKFNTGISTLMIFTNHAVKKGKVTRDTAQTFAKLLAPYAPHAGEEIWSLYGNNDTITYQTWPEVNEAFLVEDSIEYPVQINGKLRFTIEFPIDKDVKEIETEVLANEKMAKWLETGEIT